MISWPGGDILIADFVVSYAEMQSGPEKPRVVFLVCELVGSVIEAETFLHSVP